jgi:hypothetical protein
MAPIEEEVVEAGHRWGEAEAECHLEVEVEEWSPKVVAEVEEGYQQIRSSGRADQDLVVDPREQEPHSQEQPRKRLVQSDRSRSCHSHMMRHQQELQEPQKPKALHGCLHHSHYSVHMIDHHRC